MTLPINILSHYPCWVARYDKTPLAPSDPVDWDLWDGQGTSPFAALRMRDVQHQNPGDWVKNLNVPNLPLFGRGFCFTDHMNATRMVCQKASLDPAHWQHLRLVCVDIDFKHFDPTSPNRDAVKHLLRATGTYIEWSPSGNGWHAWFYTNSQGALDHIRDNFDVLGMIGVGPKAISVFCVSGYVTMTGWQVDGSGSQIVDGSKLLWHLTAGEQIPERPATRHFNVDIEPTTKNGRRLGLPDDQVMDLLPTINKSTAQLYRYTTDDPDQDRERRLRWLFNNRAFKSAMKLAGADQEKIDAAMVRRDARVNRSELVFRVIGDLDKITGDAEQVKRLMFKMPLFKNYEIYREMRGKTFFIETGEQKWERRFNREVARVRGINGA
ncbi:hypothetical protein [uncultured Roseibium sp.]|uniref:hypothetical protein n=1 Tax=uncultured Roseibium sp. TaxID=1936171 RepID=UPI003216A26B